MDLTCSKKQISLIIPELRVTYLTCIKNCFTKEWQGFYYSRSFMVRDAIRSVDNAVFMAFYGPVPKGLVQRIDKGPQYDSKEFRNAGEILGI